MDRGEWLKRRFDVLPGDHGSFVIRTTGEDYRGAIGNVMGFTSARDMLAFLSAEANAIALQAENEKQVGSSD